MKIKLLLFLTLLLNFYCSHQNDLEKLKLSPDLKIGVNTAQEGEWFGSLEDFYVTKSGDIYCVDGQDRKIKIFDNHGNFLLQFGQQGQGPGEFSYPTRIVVSNDGSIYVADNGRRNISRFAKDGKFLSMVSIGYPIVRLGIFENGNLLTEIAKFDRSDIKSSVFSLTLFDPNFVEIKDAVYQRTCANYAWVDVNSHGQMVTQKIPFSPEIQWEINANQLYIGYTDEDFISIFDEKGNHIRDVKLDFDRENIPGNAKAKWISETMDRLKDKPGMEPGIIQKCMKKIKLPEKKPTFHRIKNTSFGVMILLNEKSSGFPAIKIDKINNRDEQLLFEWDDLKYFNEHYYRVERNDENPPILICYHVSR